MTDERCVAGVHELAEEAGRHIFVSGRTIRQWYADYMWNDCHFPLDGRGHWEREWILNEEDLLLKFKKKLISLAKSEELDEATATKFVNEDLLKDEENLLKKHGLSLPISQATVHHWMHKLPDTAFEESTKHFYTDNHEKATTVKYREEYVVRQAALELRKPLWVQIPLSEYHELEKEGVELPAGHRHQQGSETFVELHVDSCSAFDKFRAEHPSGLGGSYLIRWDRMSRSPCAYGHDPEVCKCHLPLFHVGQDESIFKAYQRGKKAWKICGVRALRKKSDGPGQMVSAFQDEIRGYGFPMTEEELALVNQHRASMSAPKPPLSESPGVRYLNYGGGQDKEGWWNWEKFEVQLRDFLDCFDVLYPEFQLQMEIDWSSGHAKHRPGALNASAMNVGYRGKQDRMRDTILTEECVNMETHSHLVGTTQVTKQTNKQRSTRSDLTWLCAHRRCFGGLTTRYGGTT